MKRPIRLDGWGVAYIQEKRPRIEAICRRRELNFLAKVPESGPLQEEVVHALDWLETSHDHYSDASFQERKEEGIVEILRHLKMPDWSIRFFKWLIHKQRLRRARHMEKVRILPPSRDFH